jgi:hypothetical protein
MLNDLTYIAAGILIPIIPAYLLYRLLPARASVGGPFKGLNIQLSGAFAGYFLLVLVVFGFVYTRPTPKVNPADVYKYEVYRVSGRVNTGKTKDSQLLTLSLAPPERTVKPNGSFEFEIPVKPGQSGEATFPSLIVEHPDYETETIDLTELNSSPEAKYHLDIDKAARSIKIREPIVLIKNDAYTPNQKAQPVASPGEGTAQ